MGTNQFVKVVSIESIIFPLTFIWPWSGARFMRIQVQSTLVISKAKRLNERDSVISVPQHIRFAELRN